MATAAPPSVPQARPYRRFLTSALHTRFVHAATIAIILDWDNAFWITEKRSWFWSWFPLGPTGLRTALLFISTLAIFILYVATWKMGKRTTTSPFGTLQRSLLSSATLQIFLAYTFSAFWFGEVYLWSSPDFARLGWVIPGDVSTPDKLNERPIYLRSVFFLFAVVQSIRHIYMDSSSVTIPVAATPTLPKEAKQPPRFGRVQIDWQTLLVSTLKNTLSLVIPVSMAAPFIYLAFFRQSLWYIHLQLAKPFCNLSRVNARPIGYPPSNPLLILRGAAVGFLMVLGWELTGFLFVNFLIQEPTKKDLPLSADSRDPNGTLITGLKAKRDLVQTFAFWELASIAQKHPDRRKAILADIDRPNGPCWSTMQDIALGVVRDIEVRIQAASPTGPKPEAPSAVAETQIVTLPRIAPSVSNQPIVMPVPAPKTRVEVVESVAGRGMQLLGSSSNAWSPPTPDVKRLLEYVKPPGMPGDDTAAWWQQWRRQLMQSPLGWFLKKTDARRINAVILGHPHSQAALILNATDSVTRMLVASLSEDIYGKAVGCVPPAVRTFSSTILAIEKFVQQTGGDGLEGDIDEVELVLARLKAGVRELLSAFQLYLSDVGLGIKELNIATKAAEQRPLIRRRPYVKQQVRRVNPPDTKQISEEDAAKQPRPTHQPRDRPQGRRREMEMPETSRILFPSASQRKREFRDIAKQPADRRQAS